MAYLTEQAISALNQYLGISDAQKKYIADTKKRGFVIKLDNDEEVVIFVYPLVHKQDNTKNYFDTRDSGAYERAVTWNYALSRKMKYFCLGLNDSVPKYKNYVFSLECSEDVIEEISGTKNGQRNGPGNQIIIPNDYIPGGIFDRIQNKLGVFIAAVRQDGLRDYLEKYDNRPYLLSKDLIDLSALAESSPDEDEESGGSAVIAENIIFYGVPGCGKSFKIKKEYCNDDAYMERVVFHPDFTYSDFIGQILPTTDGDKISYPFVPGPFTRILKTAVADPTHNYYLVIEEINRGNAPAIFGEIFQLLDRENGESEYGITNTDIASQVYFDEDGNALPNHKVKIPANLFILATMNTADQNVFTLDTAFKRRWKMVSVKNEIANCDHANNPICGTTVSWVNFATAINSKIIEVGEGNLSSEDNRLGAYFVKADDLTDVEGFSEKVLMYLWNDAFKFDREKVFKPEYKTLDQLLEGFKKNLFAVFADEFGFASLPIPTVVSASSADNSDNPASDYLNGKNPALVALYEKLYEQVKSSIPSMEAYTTSGVNYIGFTAPGISKKNFADIAFKKAGILVSFEKPTTEFFVQFCTEIPYDGHHNHYFSIMLTKESELSVLAQIVVESYTGLKEG